MFSSFIPDILKPVSVMCGLTATPETTATRERVSSSPRKTPADVPASKPMSRRISQASSSASTDDSVKSQKDLCSDEEAYARMATLGRVARKAGRHVLVGDKLVLSGR
jgi:hypothetical protein